MAKRMNRGRSSESRARSLRSRERQVRDCAVAAWPSMRFQARPRAHAPLSCTRHETTEMMTFIGGFRGDAGTPLLTAEHAVEPALTVTAMPAVIRQASPGRDLRQATELTPS